MAPLPGSGRRWQGEWKKARKGTPQGGVISPLLANIYLHEMDRAFHENESGPYRVANARLVRYCADFVIPARYIGPRIIEWVERKLEEDLELHVNRDKTSIVRMDKNGETLDFLGFTLTFSAPLSTLPHSLVLLFKLYIFHSFSAFLRIPWPYAQSPSGP